MRLRRQVFGDCQGLLTASTCCPGCSFPATPRACDGLVFFIYLASSTCSAHRLGPSQIIPRNDAFQNFNLADVYLLMHFAVDLSEKKSEPGSQHVAISNFLAYQHHQTSPEKFLVPRLKMQTLPTRSHPVTHPSLILRLVLPWSSVIQMTMDCRTI